MIRKALCQLVETLDQSHLLDGIHGVADEKIHMFYQQLQSFASQAPLARMIHKEKEKKFLKGAVCPPACPSSLSLQREGLDIVKRKAFACVILAGGMGTRLGYAGPKGLFPISPFMGKTLFQIHFEKIAALSALTGEPLYVAVMVSAENKEKTQEYLVQENFFGVNPSFVRLICQEDMPFVSMDGQWLLKEPAALATGPSGNGAVFHLLEKEGVLKDWQEANIDHICVIQIDNPLADPFDLDLIAVSCKKEVDVSVKVVQRVDPNESVGVLATFNGRTEIVEYSDVAHEVDQTLFPFANTGIMCFSLPFIQKILVEKRSIPWHLAKKTAQVWDSHSLFHVAPIFKYELFIFDFFVFAQSVALVCAPREDCFSPLKEKEGPRGVEAVKKDLLFFYKKKFSFFAEGVLPQSDFELAARFCYPDPEIFKEWKGKSLPRKNYIA